MGARVRRPRRRNAVGWKPVQLVPENARAGPRRLSRVRRAPARTRRSGSRSTPDAIARPACTRAVSTVTADGRRQELPVSLELFDFALPDENSMHAMVYYASDQPELYHGRNLDAGVPPLRAPPAHRAGARLRHRDRAGRARAVHRRGLHAATAHYEGPGEGVGQRHRARVLLRAGHATTTTARARGRMRTRG